MSSNLFEIFLKKTESRKTEETSNAVHLERVVRPRRGEDDRADRADDAPVLGVAALAVAALLQGVEVNLGGPNALLSLRWDLNRHIE